MHWHSNHLLLLSNKRSNFLFLATTLQVYSKLSSIPKAECSSRSDELKVINKIPWNGFEFSGKNDIVGTDDDSLGRVPFLTAMRIRNLKEIKVRPHNYYHASKYLSVYIKPARGCLSCYGRYKINVSQTRAIDSKKLRNSRIVFVTLVAYHGKLSNVFSKFFIFIYESRFICPKWYFASNLKILKENNCITAHFIREKLSKTSVDTNESCLVFNLYHFVIFLPSIYKI